MAQNQTILAIFYFFLGYDAFALTNTQVPQSKPACTRHRGLSVVWARGDALTCVCAAEWGGAGPSMQRGIGATFTGGWALEQLQKEEAEAREEKGTRDIMAVFWWPGTSTTQK